MTRKQESNKQAVRNLIIHVVEAMKYEWTPRRNKTIILDTKELFRRLGEGPISDKEIDEEIIGL